MIISQVIGGLGNQMFQYAAGRALSLQRNQSLRLDTSDFIWYGLHQGFELQRVFVCPVKVATQAEVRSILTWQSLSRIKRIVVRPRMKAIRRKTFVVEPHFHYWAGIKEVSGDAYLSGYWQSEKYFLDVAPVIKADFTFKSPLVGCNANIAARIAKVNSVSLHVRRGDYVSNPKTNVNHGVCSLDYYRSAIRHVAERVEYPEFFIFSDDIGWVKDNLKMDFPCQYVDHNHGEKSYNDMHLMSLCRHQIIANSSFSWWGAWLNSNPDKIVIAPKKWFANHSNTQDLVPKGWVGL